MPKTGYTSKYNSNFLFEICFGLQPSKFTTNHEDRLLLDEEDEVIDMYFIMEGKVGIGYYLLAQGLSNDESYYLKVKFGKF